MSDSTTDAAPDEPGQSSEPVDGSKKVDLSKKAAGDPSGSPAPGATAATGPAPTMPITIKVAIGAMVVEAIAGLVQAVALRGSTAELTKYLIHNNANAKKPKNPYTASEISKDLHTLRTSGLLTAVLIAVVLAMVIYMMRRPRSASASRWAVLAVALLGQIPLYVVPATNYPGLANGARFVMGVACIVSIIALFFFPASTKYFRDCRLYANPNAAQRPGLFGPRPAGGRPTSPSPRPSLFGPRPTAARGAGRGATAADAANPSRAKQRAKVRADDTAVVRAAEPSRNRAKATSKSRRTDV